MSPATNTNIQSIFLFMRPSFPSVFISGFVIPIVFDFIIEHLRHIGDRRSERAERVPLHACRFADLEVASIANKEPLWYDYGVPFCKPK